MMLNCWHPAMDTSATPAQIDRNTAREIGNRFTGAPVAPAGTARSASFEKGTAQLANLVVDTILS